MKSAQQRAESAVEELNQSFGCMTHGTKIEIILRETGLEGLVECAEFVKKRAKSYRQFCSVAPEPEIAAVLKEMDELISKLTPPEA